MQKNNFVKIYFLLIILLSIVGFFQHRVFATEILVSNKVIKTLPENTSFVGVNWLYEHPKNEYMYGESGHLDKLAKTLKRINVDSIRYPGGMKVGDIFWDLSVKDTLEALKKPVNGNIPSPYLKEYSPSDKLDFFQFINFCKKNNIKATIQLNTHKYFDKKDKSIYFLKDYKLDANNKRIWSTGKLNIERVKLAAQYAARQVKWVKDNGYTNSVLYWELGNEEYIKGLDIQTFYTGGEYAQIASIFIREIKKADPGAQILLTIFALPSLPNPLEKPEYINYSYLYNWDKDLLTNPELLKVKDQIYAVTAHVYPLENRDSNTNPELYRKIIYESKLLDVKDRFNLDTQWLSKLGYKNLKIVMNEFSASDEDSDHAHSWLGAMGNSKLIMSAAKYPNCEHADIYTLLTFYRISRDTYANKGFGIMHYAKCMKEPFLLYPDANAIGLLNENIQGNILKTDYLNHNLYVITCKKQNIVKVIVLNLNNSREVNLNFKGFATQLTYLNNKSLGIDVPGFFNIIDAGDSSSYPSEVRQLNILDNQIKVTRNSSNILLSLPQNTLSVFYFKE